MKNYYRILKIKPLTKNNNQKGFSLIELILYMAILSILMIALFQLLTVIFDVQLESQSISAASSDANFILSRFEYDVGSLDSIIFPDIGSQDQSFQFSKGTETYTYSLIGDNLMLIASVSGTQDQLNSIDTKVTNLSFLRLADNLGEIDTVTINITLESEVRRRGGFETQSFTTTVGTR